MKKSKLDILDIEKIKMQYHSGLSIRQIAVIHEIPYTSLRRWCIKMNIVKVDKIKKPNGQ